MLHRLACAGLLATLIVSAAHAQPIPSSFESRAPDRDAIVAVLNTYTKAVSTKNEALFESILLSKDIPFSSIWTAQKTGRTQNYETFRKAVFSGQPFTQSMQDIHVLQDGDLASATVVYVNRAADGNDWGWKTIQFIKMRGEWKIASEFYSGHDLAKGQ